MSAMRSFTSAYSAVDAEVAAVIWNSARLRLLGTSWNQ
jgi:hypothetical protein